MEKSKKIRLTSQRQKDANKEKEPNSVFWLCLCLTLLQQLIKTYKRKNYISKGMYMLNTDPYLTQTRQKNKSVTERCASGLKLIGHAILGEGQWVSLSLWLAGKEQGEAWCTGWGLQIGGQSQGEVKIRHIFENTGCLDMTVVSDTSYH